MQSFFMLCVLAVALAAPEDHSGHDHSDMDHSGHSAEEHAAIVAAAENEDDEADADGDALTSATDDVDDGEFESSAVVIGMAGASALVWIQ